MTIIERDTHTELLVDHRTYVLALGIIARDNRDGLGATAGVWAATDDLATTAAELRSHELTHCDGKLTDYEYEVQSTDAARYFMRDYDMWADTRDTSDELEINRARRELIDDLPITSL